MTRLPSSAYEHEYQHIAGDLFELFGVKYQMPKKHEIEKDAVAYATLIVHDYYQRHLGELMFIYKDTHGLPQHCIEAEFKKLLASPDWAAKISTEIETMAAGLKKAWNNHYLTGKFSEH